MRSLAWVMLVPVAGCLSLLPAPDNLGGEVGSLNKQCDPETCSGGFTCDPIFEDECATDCYDDDSCKEGYFCCDFDEWYGDTGGTSRCRESQEYTCVRGRR